MEKEIRLKIEDFDKARELLESQGYSGEPYSFTDHIYMPKGRQWDLEKSVLLLRDVNQGEDLGVKLKFALYEYRESGVKTSVIKIMQSLEDMEQGERIMDLWNFEKKFLMKRSSIGFSKEGIAYYLENIDLIGASVEIEGESCVRLGKQLAEDLGQNFRLLDGSIPSLVQKALRA